MTDADYTTGMIAMREHLHKHGIHADDLTDTEVVSACLPDLCMAAAELRHCTFTPGSWDKRFVRSTCDSDQPSFTPKQAILLLVMRHRYRRQTNPPRGALMLKQPRGGRILRIVATS